MHNKISCFEPFLFNQNHYWCLIRIVKKLLQAIVDVFHQKLIAYRPQETAYRPSYRHICPTSALLVLGTKAMVSKTFALVSLKSHTIDF